MNILADENLESEIVTALRLAGHSVSDIKEIRPGVDDPEVLSIANRTDAILLTNDKDFGELVYRDRLFSTGIILLRFGKLESLSVLICRLPPWKSIVVNWSVHLR